MHPDVDNTENWMPEDVKTGDYEDEDDNKSLGGGSVQMNDVDNNENWVDEEFDTKSIEIREDSDDENKDQEPTEDNENENEDAKESKDTETETKTEEKFDGDIGNIIRSGGRSRRLEQMKRHRDHKGKADMNDLDNLKQKYQDRRRHREKQKLNGLFSLEDLVKGNGDEDEVDIEDTEFAMMQFTQQYQQIHADPVDSGSDEDDEDGDEDKNDAEYDANGNGNANGYGGYSIDDGDDNMPALPRKKKSVLLDIEKFSVNLAAVIEEDDDEEDDDEEKYFQTVEYQTDSDCDSNDSVVVKKEILKNVTVNDLQKFDTV